MGIELPGRAPAQGGDKVTLVHVEAVQKLQVVRPLAGLKIVVIYRVVDEVAGPAQTRGWKGSAGCRSNSSAM